MAKKEYKKPILKKEEVLVSDVIATSVSTGKFVTTQGSYGVSKSYTEIFGKN